jgi:hypothetical protein
MASTYLLVLHADVYRIGGYLYQTETFTVWWVFTRTETATVSVVYSDGDVYRNRWVFISDGDVYRNGYLYQTRHLPYKWEPHQTETHTVNGIYTWRRLFNVMVLAFISDGDVYCNGGYLYHNGDVYLSVIFIINETYCMVGIHIRRRRLLYRWVLI